MERMRAAGTFARFVGDYLKIETFKLRVRGLFSALLHTKHLYSALSMSIQIATLSHLTWLPGFVGVQWWMQANTDTQTCGLMLDRPTSLRFQRVVCLCSKPTLINEQRGSYKTERVEGDLQFNQFYYNGMTHLKLHCSLDQLYKKNVLENKSLETEQK